MAVSKSAPAKSATSGQGAKGRPGTGRPGNARGGGKGPSRPPARNAGVPRLLWGVVALVVVAVLVIVAVAVVGGGTKQKPTQTTGVGPVVSALVGIPASVVKSYGTGVTTGSGAVNTPPVPITGNQPPLTSGGKPEVFYAGAEYCPYCAAERWAMVQALSRFGTFTNLGETYSSATDVYANTPTFTFYKSTYSSPYISFVSLELSDNTGKVTLQKPTKAEQDMINKYDNAPYISGQGGSIPFIDIGNQYVQSGAEYSPAVLQGMSFQNIAAAAQTPGTPAGQAIISSANYLTAAICRITKDQPATVCNQPFVPEARAKMDSAAKSSGSSGNATPGAAG